MALVGTSQAASWDYWTNNGEDWPSLDIDGNMCGSTNQSPINLISRKSDDFKYPIYEAEDDMVEKIYSN